mgnify:CR=1 FL=1
MSFKEFSRDDVFHNTIVAHPEFEFFVYNQKAYINRESAKTGNFSNTVNHVPQGFISLHEINVNRPANSMVYPFITKDGARTAFRTITTSTFQDTAQFAFGDVVSSSYPLSASVGRIYVPTTKTHINKKYLRSLRSAVDLSGHNSQHFKFDNFISKSVNIIEIPSIFYGSGIKRGSVNLEYYITGTLLARVQDDKKNGELIQTYGPNSGSVAGIVLYNYGMCLLTGSWDLSTHADSKNTYFDASTLSNPNWLNFGSGLTEPGASSTKSGQTVNVSASYLAKIEGTNKIPTITMLAHANKSEFNYSKNPTFVDFNSQLTASIANNSYKEELGNFKNITKSRYPGHYEDYENTTYISQIGIYDEDKNLIGVAKLANPVKKTEIREYMFKMRLDF